MAKSADAFRTISEVADWLETPAHVLRFWESKFSQVKPVKRAGGRRYYRPSDMLLLGGIKKLLHSDGMTIKGVQKLLREKGIKHVAGHSQPLDDVTVAEADEAAMAFSTEPVRPPEETVVDFQRGALKDADQPVEVDAEQVTTAAPPSQEGSTDVDQPASTAQEEPASTEPATEPDVEDAPVEAAESDAEADHTAQPDAAPEAEAETVTDLAPETAEEAPEAASEISPDEPPEDPVDKPPVMPSFSHRPVEPAPKEDEEITAEAASPPKPARIDIPDDPADDIEAAPGVLTQVAALRPPISNEMADRLGLVLDRLRQGGGGNGPGQGS